MFAVREHYFDARHSKSIPVLLKVVYIVKQDVFNVFTFLYHRLFCVYIEIFLFDSTILHRLVRNMNGFIDTFIFP